MGSCPDGHPSSPLLCAWSLCYLHLSSWPRRGFSVPKAWSLGHQCGHFSRPSAEAPGRQIRLSLGGEQKTGFARMFWWRGACSLEAADFGEPVLMPRVSSGAGAEPAAVVQPAHCTEEDSETQAAELTSRHSCSSFHTCRDGALGRAAQRALPSAGRRLVSPPPQIRTRPR